MNPRASYLAHKEEIDAAIARVLDRGSYILGEEVARFEEEFAAYVGAEAAIGVASGTDALELALRACGVGPDDAVLTVANTAVATVAAIDRIGAEAVFADVDARTFTIDCADAEERIERHSGKPIRAIVPVHLYGHPAAMEEVARLASARGLAVVEDCAQSHGASIGGRRTGSFGAAAAFSFYPTKNLGALGDGGMVVTSDAAIAGRVRLLRQYGWQQRYVSETRGWNSRLDELQAAILRIKLRHLDAENERRRFIASKYADALRATTVTPPFVQRGCTHVFHQFVVRTKQREAFRKTFAEQGIDTAVLYPVPIHLQPAYRSPRRTPLPVTEMIVDEIVSVPIFPQMAGSEIDRVVEILSGC